MSFLLAANVGARTDNPKMCGDGVSLQVLLHDIHMSLVKNILIVRKNQHDAAIQLLNKIPCPGIISMKFNYRILCVIYITDGWYGCIEIDQFQALVTICSMFH